MSITSLDKLKRFLQITDTSQDTFLQELLDRAEKKIETALETKFYAGGDTSETLDEKYNNGIIIATSYRPILSVEQITSNGDPLIENNDYYVYAEFVQMNDDTPPSNKTIEIKYTAGYVGIPEDIEQAIILTAANYLKINSELQPNQSVDYRMPQEVKDLIQPYRRIIL